MLHISGVNSVGRSLLKSLYFTCTLVLLGACGGGSDDNGEGIFDQATENLAPIAEAGDDQSVNENTDVGLSGSGSDSDGSIASYQWSQSSGESVSLSDADSATASFTAPAVIESQTLVFSLTVTDNSGATASDTVTITVNPVFEPGEADAGTDQTVSEGGLVTLQAGDSSGDIVSYSWVQTGGIAVILSDAGSASPTFSSPDVDSVTTLTFELTITDSNGGQTVDSVSVTVNPSVSISIPPVANAGADLVVEENGLIIVGGSGADEDGEIVSYAWVQTGGVTVALINADSAFVSFTAPETLGETTLSFELTVTDNDGNTASDSVDIRVINVNKAPVADAGENQSVNENSAITLSGAGEDNDGSVVAYEWVQVGGTSATIEQANSAEISFTSPEVANTEILSFQLRVTDNEGGVGTDIVRVTVININKNPVANAGADFDASENTVVTLSGSGTDEDGSIASYSWEQTDGVTVSLSNVFTATPSFTAPEVIDDTPLSFELTVEDNQGGTAQDTVIVTIGNVNKVPVVNAGNSQSVIEGITVNLSVSASDLDGEIASYLWQQTSGETVTISNSASANASFTSPSVSEGEVANLSFSVTVTDNEGGVTVDTVSVSVSNVNPPVADAGTDQTVNENTIASLQGSASDSDGSIVSYSWSQVSGVDVSIEDPASASTFFTAPEIVSDETLVFQLQAFDNDGASDTDTVTIVIANVNKIPTVDAGSDATIVENSAVGLSGEGTDLDGTIASYSWTQTAGDTVSLQGAGTASASFTAPAVETNQILTFELTVTDNEGASSSDTVDIEIIPDVAVLTSLLADYSASPTLNAESTISLISSKEVGEVEWTVDSEPAGSSLSLDVAVSQDAISFTPTQAGEYQIRARSVANRSEKLLGFYINESFSFDEADIEGNGEGAVVEELIGSINNQAWVFSSSLSESQLSSAVTALSGFTVLGYDAVEGLLIEYDPADSASLEALEELKLTDGVLTVSNRLYEGENADRANATVPDDGSGFSDDGDNWHLEAINAVDAWDVTQGSADIEIAVTDAGFDSDHSELDGRVSEKMTSISADHGTAAAGAIGAVTDNGTGMSGVNWVSSLVLERYGIEGLKSVLSKERVAVVNNSWAIAASIANTFDPEDGEHVNARNAVALAATRPYRRMAQANPDQLLVWSAGNGIANGAGSDDGVFGVYAGLDNAALHLNKDGQMQKLDNVIVAAASRLDGRLVHYSNYGNLVDIAAPTSYKSLADADSFLTGTDYGDGESGFAGTSAAAAVVSGVASLIYSLYPEFSGEEVKAIMVNSATEFVTERYIGPGEGAENIAPLTYSIPVLDAEAALAMAQSIVDEKTVVSYTIPNPFSARARLEFSSVDSEYDVASIDMILQSSDDAGQTWDDFSNWSVSSDVVNPLLNTETPYHRAVASIVLRNLEDSSLITVNKTFDFSFSEVALTARDTVSLSPVAEVEITLEALDGESSSSSSFTDNDGLLNVYVREGSYFVRGQLESYQNSVKTLNINQPLLIASDLIMATDAVGTVGALSGQVLDGNGDPVESASVRISGGAQTNGFFASANTDENGYWDISNISKTDSDGEVIESFSLEASAFGYSTASREDIVILAGKERVETFTVISQDLMANTLFADDFEAGVGAWIATGFWHQENLSNSDLINTLVQTGNVSLAADEEGPQALLPEAFSGDVVWWYGQPDTGTFVGVQSESSSELDGGRSEEANEGTLTSPVISLVDASLPQMRFRTWWEIESVNPNENGFDLLEVQVSTDGGEIFTTIKKLNPFVDPNDTNRASKPFSSGGYNREPVWALETFDLTEYLGQEILVRFSFDTRDTLYNGFRGWFIDSFEILDFVEEEEEVVESVPPKAILQRANIRSNSLLEFDLYAPREYSSELMPPRDN